MANELQKIAQKFFSNSSKKFLWIYGKSGTGKTRLVNSLARGLKNENKKVRSGSAQKFVSLLVKYLQQRRISPLIDYCKNYDLLVLDNIDLALSNRPNTQEEIKRVLLEIADNGKTKIVLVGIAHPEKLPKLEFSERDCHYVSFDAPDFAFKVKMLSKWARQSGITIPKQILIDAADFSDNFFQLKGWFNQFCVNKPKKLSFKERNKKVDIL